MSPFAQQVRLRQCEYRLRNCDQLRVDTTKLIPEFAALHLTKPWHEARAAATEIMICARACMDEYQAIIDDIACVEVEGVRRDRVIDHAKKALEMVTPIHESIVEIITASDLGAA